MVDETRLSTLCPGINVNVSIERHDIKHPFVFVPAKEFLQISLSDGPPHVFYDEFPLPYVFECHEASALRSGIYDFDVLPFLLGNPPISTSISRRAISWTLF
jgi:hypothetical protein